MQDLLPTPMSFQKTVCTALDRVHGCDWNSMHGVIGLSSFDRGAGRQNNTETIKRDRAQVIEHALAKYNLVCTHSWSVSVL